MSSITPLVNGLAIVSYMVAAIYQGMFLINKQALTSPNRSILLAFGVIGLIAHGIGIYTSVSEMATIDLSFFRVAPVIFWFIVLASLMELVRRPVNNLLLVVLPLAIVSIITSIINTPGPTVETQLSSGLFSHLISSFLAFSFMTIAAIQALTLAIQERLLKHHHIGGLLQALPPLQTMEHILFELIWVGMVLLTLSLSSGVFFVEDLSDQNLIHKIFFSFLGWVMFAVLLWGRHQNGWRGKTAIRWTIGGFVALVLGYFGSKFVLELLLQ